MKFIALMTLVALGNTAVLQRGSLRGRVLHAQEAGRASAALENLVHGLLAGEGGFELSRFIDVASRHIDVTTAAQALTKHHKIPGDVETVLVKGTSNGTRTSALDEESLAKARNFLNTMVEKAQAELDDKIIEAKEFHARNRGTQAQVVSDIATLSGYIAGFLGQISESETCISAVNDQVTLVKSKRKEEQDAYEAQHKVNFNDLEIKQKDLALFDFLIKQLKQIRDSHAALLIELDDSPSLQVCSSNRGAALRFKDVRLQAKFDQILSKASRDLLSSVLFRTDGNLTSFLQLDFAQPAPQKTPVTSGQADDLEFKCVPIPDLGELYDALSAQWGMSKDRVDELKADMESNAAAWGELKQEFDDQIDSLKNQLADCSRTLSESTSSKNKDAQELAEKQSEQRRLDEEHVHTMRQFRERITSVVQQDICGPTVIRNEIMKESSQCPPKGIDDCDVTPWTAETCSVECDDQCPDLRGCGGTQTLTRTVVVRPNACGIQCPDLTRHRRCNQVKCPVDCVMSRWSGWSKCSKECEGGVQQETRAVIARQKNGGQACSAVSEARACHTFSCDRDCSLQDWTAWSPCSMACGGGNQLRVRNVEIPIRGDGKCPTPQSATRHENQQCNTHQCSGDEVCIAKQDLVIAVDGSGSIKSEGFKLVKNFTGELIKRYTAEYYAETTMQLGLVLFGNGVIEDDGSISKARLLQELSTDLAATQTAVASMQHQKGFTNMAQAFVLANKLLMQRGRKEAQSAVLTISDGKPSFLFETRAQAKALESKGITRFMVGIAEFQGSDEWQLMRELASQPAATNTVRVPGIDALQDGGGAFVEQALVRFCPASVSPSQTLQEEKQEGYMLVRKGGYCGRLGMLLSEKIYGADLCAELARRRGATSFSLGSRWRRGRCNAQVYDFNCDVFKQWQEQPGAPACSASGSDDFHSSAGYDWYALQPDCAASLVSDSQ